jgi:hypothetical protein
MLCVYIYVLHAHKVVFRKMTLYMAYVKMTKFIMKISLFKTYFFCLFAQPIENVCFPRNYARPHRI